MPQLQLEYSANVTAPPTPDLLLMLHQILADHGVKIGNCKSRAVERDVYLVADGKTGEAFVHLDVSFMEGRSPELKTSIGNAMLSALRTEFGDDGVQITVEIRDIKRDAYFKFPGGTL